MRLRDRRIEGGPEQRRVHLVGDLLQPPLQDGKRDWIQAIRRSYVHAPVPASPRPEQPFSPWKSNIRSRNASVVPWPSTRRNTPAPPTPARAPARPEISPSDTRSRRVRRRGQRRPPPSTMFASSGTRPANRAQIASIWPRSSRRLDEQDVGPRLQYASARSSAASKPSTAIASVRAMISAALPHIQPPRGSCPPSPLAGSAACPAGGRSASETTGPPAGSSSPRHARTRRTVRCTFSALPNPVSASTITGSATRSRIRAITPATSVIDTSPISGRPSSV